MGEPVPQRLELALRYQLVTDLTNLRYVFESTTRPNIVWVDLPELDFSEGSGEARLNLIDKLEDPAAELVRKDGFFKDLGLSADDYTTPEAVADLLVEHPRLMQRPVLVRGDRAIIGRPRDRVVKFLT